MLMAKIARVVSWLSLLGVIAPAILYLYGSLSLASVQTTMLVSSFAWFGTVPLWLDRKR